MGRSKKISLPGRIKASPIYAWLLAVVELPLSLLYRALYVTWPDATRRALSRSVPLLGLKKIVKLKVERDPSFRFDGRELGYFFHSYNNFRLTERSVEVPIIQDYMARLDPRETLEIGNVCNYYYTAFASVPAFGRRTVVDKYEGSAGVVQADVADYRPGQRYDFIFSISTFEHMDADRGFNPEYVAGGSRLISHAADNIRHVLDDLLADGGVFVLTAPIGYSDEWDATFYSGELEKLGAAYRAFGFEKRGELNWHPVDPDRGLEAGLTRRFPEMGFVVILEFRK